MKTCLLAIERFVTTREPRFSLASLSLLSKLRTIEGGEGRKGQGAAVLRAAIASTFPPSHPQREALLSLLAPLCSPLSPSPAEEGERGEKEKPKQLLPEAELLLSLTVLVLLIDANKKEEAKLDLSPRHLPSPPIPHLSLSCKCSL